MPADWNAADIELPPSWLSRMSRRHACAGKANAVEPANKVEKASSQLFGSATLSNSDEETWELETWLWVSRGDGCASRTVNPSRTIELGRRLEIARGMDDEIETRT